MKRRVLVLGATGMLGSMVAEQLGASGDLELFATTRTGQPARGGKPCKFAVGDPLDSLPAVDVAINCAGTINRRIDEADPASVAEAIRVNALFPQQLAQELCRERGVRVLHITTDCVFRGTAGRPYLEDDPADALDAYGKSKSLGEAKQPGFTSLRCSIVGPQAQGIPSLLAWFLAQPQGAVVPGFTRHLWNGLTTLHLARLLRAALDVPELPGLLHVVPADAVSKAELLRSFAARFRPDLRIADRETDPVDRRIATRHEPLVRDLWRAAGHAQPPTIDAMVAELAEHVRA